MNPNTYPTAALDDVPVEMVQKSIRITTAMAEECDRILEAEGFASFTELTRQALREFINKRKMRISSRILTELLARGLVNDLDIAKIILQMAGLPGKVT